MSEADTNDNGINCIRFILFFALFVVAFVVPPAYVYNEALKDKAEDAAAAAKKRAENPPALLEDGTPAPPEGAPAPAAAPAPEK